MKLIVAIVKPQRVDAVREALDKVGVSGMTVTEVQGFGRQKGHREVYRGTEYQVDFVPKCKIEIAMRSSKVDAAVKTICSAAKTGAIGDGKIFVLNLESAVRVRTGEFGEDAI